MPSIHEPSETARDNLQPMLRLARRALAFWRPALVALAIGVAATVAVAKLRPRNYRSEAVLYYREGMQWNPNEGFSTRRQIQRLKEALLARSQLVKVIEDLGLYPKLMSTGRSADAVNEMLLATTFRIGEGDIFQLSYTSDSPQEAERVVSRLTALLIDENTTFRSSQAESSRAFLETEKSHNQEDLHAKEAALFRFLALHPEFVQEQGTAAGAPRGGGTRRSEDDGSALASLRREEERLQAQIATSSNVSADPGVAISEAASKLKAAQRDLAAARSRYTEEHPDVRSARALVKDAEDAYRRTAATAEGAAAPVSVTELQARLDRVQREIATVDKRGSVTSTQGTSAAKGNAARHVVSLETEWARLNRDVTEARERLQQLDSRQFTASMTLGTLMSGQAGKILVIDPAFVPTTPIGISNTKVLLLGLALTLVLSTGLATTLALLDDRIRDRIDILRLGLGPLLVEIGDLARKPGKPGQQASLARDRTPTAPPSRQEDAVPEVRSLSLLAPPPTGARPAWAEEATAGSGEAMQGSTSLALKLPLREDLAVRGSVAMREPDPGRGKVMVNVHRVLLERENQHRPLMLEEPDSAAAAGFRVLRHRLVERGGARAVLVASPNSRDGKTTCALNLWVALGEGRRSRALLVEANLRDPAIARSIGFDPPVCIGKQLEYHLSLGVHAWDVAETFTPWLHAAAVSPSSEKREMVDGSALTALVRDMRDVGYDIVVVDSPAILGSADATLAEDAVEGVLMVIRRGRTRARDVRRAVDQIGSDKLLGFVLLGG